jgi:hypothetical protein
MAPHGGGDDASSVKSGGGGSSSSAAGGGGVSHLELTDLGGNGGTQPAADDRPTGKKGKEKEKQLPDAEYIDTDKYVVKVQPQERAAYWAFLVTTKRPVKIPEGQETDEEVVERTFPWHQGLLFTIVTSQFWDYVYVVFLMAFLTLIGLKRDGFLPSDFAEYVWSVCTAMLVLMFFSQVVPIVGMVYFVNYANLRTHYRASQNFPSWCVMQFLSSLYPPHTNSNAILISLNPFVCPYTQELDVGHGCAIHRRAFLRRRGQLRETEGTRLRGPSRGPGERRREQRGREHRQQHQGGDEKAWRVEGAQTDQGACVRVGVFLCLY